MADLDPIVSLAVGLATSPGAYAFVLGSGISREAGIPTGEEIVCDTLDRLYQVETGEPPESADARDEWLERQGLRGSSYAEILERVLPGQQSRHDYLARLFEGKGPGPTHRALARLAASGLVKVFVTTNFDPLLEVALRAEGLQPVVVSDAASLRAAPARETTPVFVLKPHGDAGQLTLRNTSEEVAALEEDVEAELSEICARHGLVVMGYAGRDPAMARALRMASPRFGLYWLRRGSLTPDALSIVEAASGHVIQRESAGAFVGELERRVALWRDHPTGTTPAALRSEIIDRLRAADEVGVSELARAERQRFEERSMELFWDAGSELGSGADPDRLRVLEGELAALLERRWATVFALIEHRGSLSDEIEWLAEFSARELPGSLAYSAWIQAPRYLAWMLIYSYGAVGCALRRFAIIRALWDRQEPTVEAAPLGALRQRGGAELGAALERARTGKQLRGDGAWHLAFLLADSQLVRSHYPELLRHSASDNALGALSRIAECSYFFSALGGRDDIAVIGLWSLQQAEPRIPLRLERDQVLQSQVTSGIFPELDAERDDVSAVLREWRDKNTGPSIE